MTDTRIRNLIYDNVINTFTDNISTIEIIVICSIMYKNIKNMISSGVLKDSYQINSTITEQLELVYQQVKIELIKNISLDDISNYISSNELGNFKLMTNNHINNIVRLFNNREEYKSFNTKYFTSSMYKVAGSYINIIYMKKLRYIHKNVMIPIINYYKENYNDIYDYSLEIISSTSGRYPGKIINFKISNIKAETIANDIFMNRINIPYLKINSFDDTVEIVTTI